MKRFLIIPALLFPLLGAAQQAPNKALQFNWSLNSKQRTEPIVFTQSQYQPSFQVQQIKYTLPKAAIFCRMEEAVYKRYNFLFKIRMGSDDRYSD